MRYRLLDLVLTVTRRCDLRCAYCPTAKDGHPDLSAASAVAALELFSARYGGGDVKLFGGEPLLVPDVVAAVLERADSLPRIRRVQLSTNGLGLDAAWLDRIEASPKAVLTVSMDGAPDDHRRFRRTSGAIPVPGPDAYTHVVSLLPRLRRVPRVVITQTIPPANAARAADNFEHLLGLGFTRFNLLPGYFLPWREEQIAALRASFERIGERIRARWEAGEPLYLRNLFTWAPTPFFNTGLVVDSDGSIHSSNVVLSGKLEELGARTRLGSLDDPPTVDALRDGAERTWRLLQRELPARIVESTLAADAELSRLVRGLYPAFARKRRRATAASAVA